MYDYQPPGVYFEWLDKAPATSTQRTDVAAFVGIAARGPLCEPIRLSSWDQFLSTFGEHIVQGYLAYAVEGFFANGGRTCWVVRVADPVSAKPAFLDLTDRDGGFSVRLHASSKGTWGNQLSATVTPIDVGRFRLVLNLGEQLLEQWDNLRLNASANGIRSQTADVGALRGVVGVLNDQKTGSRWMHAVDPPTPLTSRNELRLLDHRSVRGQFEGGADGLSCLTAQHFLDGLDKLAEVEEACIIAIPDLMPKPIIVRHEKRKMLRCHVLDQAPQPVIYNSHLLPIPPIPNLSFSAIECLQKRLIRHCEEHGDRVAILDMPPADDGETPRTLTEAIDWRRRFDSDYAALYYPWVCVLDPLQNAGDVRIVPPCGHIAGIYAQVEQAVGVHKAPANEILQALEDVQVYLDERTHGILNAAHVNVLRSVPGRSIRIQGARLLSTQSAWRYVNVRRLIVYIRKTLERQLSWAVFEPNNATLRSDVSQFVGAFMLELWRVGMLDGATPEEAFSVRCNDVTTPHYEAEQGRLICEISLRPAWPAEYIVVRFSIHDSGVEYLVADERSNA